MDRDAAPDPPPPALRLLRRLVLVEPHEVRATLLAAAYFFFVLASYYVLRPVRDEMGVLGGVEDLAWLFSGTLAAMLLVHPLFAALVSRTPRSRFVPIAYRCFGASLLLFFLLLRASAPEHRLWAGRALFVWVTVFNVFVVSVFWSFLADVFRPDQGARLFAFIGVGGTLGAMAGAEITRRLAPALGPANLLVVSALLLEVAVQCARRLGRHARAAGPGAGAGEREPLGGRAWDGLARVARSPYLAGLCLFVLLFAVGSTFVYFQQAAVFEREVPDSGRRTALFASVDLAVNGLTLVTQLFVTGRLLRRLGVGAGLAFLPLLSIAGFATLWALPAVATVVAFQTLRRAGNFAVTGPSREVLFTTVPRADKYKAKNFIDTFVLRLGDQLGAWTYTLLGAQGVGVRGIALLAMPLSAAWLANALWLARRHRRALAARPSPDEASAAPSPALTP